MVSRRLAKKSTSYDRLKELLAQEAPWSPKDREEVLGYCGDGSGRGDFFTPARVAGLVHAATRPLLGDGPLRILEPSAGIGRMLAPWHDEEAGHRLEAIESHYTYGSVLERLYPNLALSKQTAVGQLSERAGLYDLVVGNPPFGAAKGLPGEVSRGTLEGYFLEAGLKALRPGGVLAFLVPDGLLNKDKDRDFRRWMMETFRLVAVLSLPTETFIFSGTSVKTSILILKNSGPAQGDDKVFMGLIERIGWDSRGNPGKDDSPKVLAAYFQFLQAEGLLEQDVALPLCAEDAEELGLSRSPVADATPVSDLPAGTPAQPLVQLSLLDELERAA